MVCLSGPQVAFAGPKGVGGGGNKPMEPTLQEGMGPDPTGTTLVDFVSLENRFMFHTK